MDWSGLLAPAIIPSLIALGIAVVTWVYAHRESKRHTKLASAQLILDLKKPWHKDEFKEFLQKMQSNDADQRDKKKIEEFLNQMEDIAVFLKDGVLTDEHVKEMFGANLKDIIENECIYGELMKWNKQNPDYTFVNLIKLLKKAESWKL